MKLIDKNIRIAVIGGGISGFAVGISLQNHGFTNVHIYERDTGFDSRREGYGLTMLQGINALKSLGQDVYESVKALDIPSRSHFIFDPEGNILNFFGTVFWEQPTKTNPSKSKKYNLHVSRQNLRRILKDKLNSLTEDGAKCVKWGSKLLDIQPFSLRLEFEGKPNGVTSFSPDLVIGCDGIHSVVRGFKYPSDTEDPLNYLGIMLVLGITSTNHSLGQSRVFQTGDGTSRLFAMPHIGQNPKHNIMWQLSFPIEEAEAKRLAGCLKDLKELVVSKYSLWHAPIPDLMESTDLQCLMGIPAYDRDTPTLFGESHSRIVLIGDAAHPMSPFKGQGANQALIDAVSFSAHLANASTIESAIMTFEEEMITRVRSKVLLSRERVTTFHQPTVNEMNSTDFNFKGFSQDFLRNLRVRAINANSGDRIEQLIIEEMVQS